MSEIKVLYKCTAMTVDRIVFKNQLQIKEWEAGSPFT